MRTPESEKTPEEKLAELKAKREAVEAKKKEEKKVSTPADWPVESTPCMLHVACCMLHVAWYAHAHCMKRKVYLDGRADR